MASTEQVARSRLRDVLPHGIPLPDEDWQRRHRRINLLAVVHAPAVWVYGLVLGYGLWHVSLETVPVIAAAAVGRQPSLSRRTREIATTLALVASSAALVHMSGGYIEMHFHFFVVVALVTLYQQWQPFLVAVGFVALHHGIAGAIDPTGVYNHPDAIAHPWRWAGVHAGFIAMESAVCITTWRLNEVARQRAEEYFKHVWDGEHALVQRLQETDRVKSELVAAISHEFRTPLTSILGFANALQRVKPITDEQVDDFAERIHRQGQRLTQLVDNLLVYEKPVDGAIGSCDAGEAVAASIRFAPIADGPSSVVTEVTPGLQFAMAPETAQLLLANLIGNAAKFRTPATPIHVRVMPERRGGVSIEVTNQGPPIHADAMSRIFEPFVQADSSDTRVGDGIGLGLYIVARIVAAADGEVRAHSDRGATTFTVWLPEPGTDDGEASMPVGLRTLEPLPGIPGD